MILYPQAFIYDLDGVITDTAEFHFLAWKKLADELGISIDKQFNEQLKGISRMESLEHILKLNSSLLKLTSEEKVRLANQKNEYYLELVESINSSNILPGIETLLSKNKEQNIKIALGSASKNAPQVLDKLGLTKYFDYVVDASKVEKGKPDPETFTTAADYLGIPYTKCIGIEDAAAGIEAINKADMFSVGVGAVEHLSHADYLVGDTSELIFEEIVKQYIEKSVFL
ncbi:beta-phosphoglucomutase [Psychrobacillus sp. NPDC058041]|uniref:beta-phosphoglucomutase n=1 Tax=Psychrobacillus sp. NPDC058041 TaxID=3346310 RepID=UPI0036DA3C6A